MATIDDFVNHRWADAKEALRQLDPDYVNRLESTARLQRVGLEHPFPADMKEQPKKRLSKEWHHPLEPILKTKSLITRKGSSREEAGVEAKFQG